MASGGHASFLPVNFRCFTILAMTRRNSASTLEDRREIVSYLGVIFVFVIILTVNHVDTNSSLPTAAAALAAVNGGAKTIKIAIAPKGEKRKKRNAHSPSDSQATLLGIRSQNPNHQ